MYYYFTHVVNVMFPR